MSAIEIDDKLLDGYLNQIAKHSGKYKRSIQRVVWDALMELVTDDEGRITNTPYNMILMEDLLQSDVFARAGYDEYAKQVINRFQYRLNTANNLMTNLGLTSAVVDNLDELPSVISRIDRVANKLADSKRILTRQLSEDMLGVHLGETPRNQFVKNLQNRAGVHASYGHTVANTELMAMDRHVRILQADKASVQLFKYVGPSDRVTRPFCQEYLNEVRDADFWARLTNRTGPQPVSEYCGGYNCRHRLIPWRAEWG